jgi:hypothetical protein
MNNMHFILVNAAVAPLVITSACLLAAAFVDVVRSA